MLADIFLQFLTGTNKKFLNLMILSNKVKIMVLFRNMLLSLYNMPYTILPANPNKASFTGDNE